MLLNCIPLTVCEKPHFLEGKYDWIPAPFHFSSESKSKSFVEFYDMSK